jgi:hypothetical protein
MPDQSAVLTLSSYMRHRSCDGLNPSPRSVFVLEKSQRDRLVLLDTPLAPLLRRYHTSDDVQRYSVLPSTRYLLCLPPGWTAQHCGTHADGNAAWQCIAEHFPALSRHLALAVAERPFTSGHWWELAPESVLPPNQPIITWHQHRTQVYFASITNGAVPATPWYQQSSPWLLGYLNSTPVQRWIQRTSAARNCAANLVIDELPVPQAVIEHSDLDAHASAAQALVMQRHQLVQGGLMTLMRNFAPLGASTSVALKSWYDLDFASLRKALVKAFKNDIPERLHPEWNDWLHEQHVQHVTLTHQINAHDSAINTVVADVSLLAKG